MGDSSFLYDDYESAPGVLPLAAEPAAPLAEDPEAQVVRAHEEVTRTPDKAKIAEKAGSAFLYQDHTAPQDPRFDYLRNPPSDQGDVAAGFEQNIRGLKQLGSAGVAAVGEALGFESWQEWGIENYKELEEESAEAAKGRTATLEQIEDIGTGIDWLQYQFGQGLGSLTETIGVAAISALLAGPPGGFAGLAGAAPVKAALKNRAKKYADTLMEKYAGRYTREQAEKIATKSLVRKYAAATGVVLNSYGIGVGDIYGELINEDGSVKEGALSAAFGGAIPYALLDSIVELTAWNKIVRGTNRGKVVKRVLKQLGIIGAQEGATEGAQEAVKMWAATQAGKIYSGEEWFSAIANSTAAGSVAGATMGVPVGISGKREAPVGGEQQDTTVAPGGEQQGGANAAEAAAVNARATPPVDALDTSMSAPAVERPPRATPQQVAAQKEIDQTFGDESTAAITVPAAEQAAVRAATEQPTAEEAVAVEQPAVEQPVAVEQPAAEEAVAVEQPVADTAVVEQPIAAEQPTKPKNVWKAPVIEAQTTTPQLASVMNQFNQALEVHDTIRVQPTGGAPRTSSVEQIDAAEILWTAFALEGMDALTKEGYTKAQLTELRTALKKAATNGRAPTKEAVEKTAGHPLTGSTGYNNLRAAGGQSGNSKAVGVRIERMYRDVQRALDALAAQGPGGVRLDPAPVAATAVETPPPAPEAPPAPKKPEAPAKAAAPEDTGIVISPAMQAKYEHGKIPASAAVVVFEDETGKTKRVKADSALARADNRVKALQKLRECLRT